MRIGILTLHLNANYGGILQNFALQTVLKRMGHDVRTIKKKKFSLPLWKAPLTHGKRILLKILGKGKYPVFYEQKQKRERPIIEQNTSRFVNNYIQIKTYKNYSDIKEEEYNAFVVGSDQVWRPDYFASKIEHAYLKFAKNWEVKRIAYAASFGTDDWEYTPKQTIKCGRLLKLFDAVSVREKSGVVLCKTHFDVDAFHILDPTMLLETKDYIHVFEVANTPPSLGSMLVYILDDSPEKNALIKKIAKEKGLVPFRVNNSKEGYSKAALQERIQPSVEQWIRGFYDAEYVVTDSFHGCVFSILFRKPFIALGNERRGMSRFSSLLNTFGLQERLVTDLTKIKHLGEIDWDSVYEKLSRLRILSMDYLIQSLK